MNVKIGIFTTIWISLIFFIISDIGYLTNNQISRSKKEIVGLYNIFSIGMDYSIVKSQLDKETLNLDVKIEESNGSLIVNSPWYFFSPGGGWSLNIEFCHNLVSRIIIRRQDDGILPVEAPKDKIHLNSDCNT